MALREFSLDQALKYAQRAVASVATSLSAVSLDHITSRELHDVSALASYWDTLGWVYFQRKELPNAEKYLLAAWQLRRDGVIGNQIGQVYEKLGRKDDAIRYYSLSLPTPNPEPGTSDRLVALAGKDAISAEKLAAYSDQLAETSVVQIPGAPEIDAAADFYVELAPAKMPNVTCGQASRLAPGTPCPCRQRPAETEPHKAPASFRKRVPSVSRNYGRPATGRTLAAFSAQSPRHPTHMKPQARNRDVSSQ
jgi:tetratricopeptide (TPR) repeat protein